MLLASLHRERVRVCNATLEGYSKRSASASNETIGSAWEPMEALAAAAAAAGAATVAAEAGLGFKKTNRAFKTIMVFVFVETSAFLSNAGVLLEGM